MPPRPRASVQVQEGARRALVQGDVRARRRAAADRRRDRVPARLSSRPRGTACGRAPFDAGETAAAAESAAAARPPLARARAARFARREGVAATDGEERSRGAEGAMARRRAPLCARVRSAAAAGAGFEAGGRGGREETERRGGDVSERVLGDDASWLIGASPPPPLPDVRHAASTFAARARAAGPGARMRYRAGSSRDRRDRRRVFVESSPALLGGVAQGGGVGGCARSADESESDKRRDAEAERWVRAPGACASPAHGAYGSSSSSSSRPALVTALAGAPVHRRGAGFFEEGAVAAPVALHTVAPRGGSGKWCCCGAIEIARQVSRRKF